MLEVGRPGVSGDEQRRQRAVFRLADAAAGFVKGVEDQWVPLDPQLQATLEALPWCGRKVFHFVNKRTGEPVTPDGLSRIITNLARKAGVRLSMKTLRKGFGSRYAGKVPAQVLQKLMRHASISTTRDFYANIDNAVEEAILGASECNSSGNSEPMSAPGQMRENAASSCEDEVKND